MLTLAAVVQVRPPRCSSCKPVAVKILPASASGPHPPQSPVVSHTRQDERSTLLTYFHVASKTGRKTQTCVQ